SRKGRVHRSPEWTIHLGHTRLRWPASCRLLTIIRAVPTVSIPDPPREVWMADLRKPTVVVLTGAESGMGHPPGMTEAEALADVRYVRSAELASALPAADALFVWDFRSTAVADAWPPAGDRPRWVHIASAGVDRLLFPGLVSDEPVVTNPRGLFDEPIADYVLLLV